MYACLCFRYPRTFVVRVFFVGTISSSFGCVRLGRCFIRRLQAPLLFDCLCTVVSHRAKVCTLFPLSRCPSLQPRTDPVASHIIAAFYKYTVRRRSTRSSVGCGTTAGASPVPTTGAPKPPSLPLRAGLASPTGSSQRPPLYKKKNRRSQRSLSAKRPPLAEACRRRRRRRQRRRGP